MRISEAALAGIAARCTRRWDRHYSRAKLRTDPVYAAVAEEIAASPQPVLDIGCGIGLLAHYLRAIGHTASIAGIDYDKRKIASAIGMAAELRDVAFAFADARRGLPEHRGHVVILDILQFFQPEDQDALLRLAAERVAPGGKLIIRSGLRDASWRYRVTVAGDWLARVTLWMKSRPLVYPTSAQMTGILQSAGLEPTIRPLWGGTPFNNHLILAQRVVRP